MRVIAVVLWAVSLSMAAQAPAPQGMAHVAGQVVDQNGAAIAVPAMVTVSAEGGYVSAAPVKEGSYRSEDLAAGTYTLQVEAQGFTAPGPVTVAVTANQELKHTFVLATDPSVISPITDRLHEITGLLAVFVYLVSVLLTRWFKIAKQSRNLLEAQILAVDSRLQTDVEANRQDVAPLREQLQKSRSNFFQGKWWSWSGLSRFFFWSQNNENACWKAVHEVERQLASHLAPDELVKVNLIKYGPQLRALKSDSAKALAEAIADELKLYPGNVELRRRLVAEATAITYEQRDNSFIMLMEWQNKAMWLILTACILIILAEILGGHIFLFVAGAAGGLLSRLARSLESQNTPSDYGASWTTLFLSPLTGALSAWFGVALITLLTQPKIGVLGHVFDLVQWNTPTNVPTAAVAVVLGFAERWFGSLADAVQKQAQKQSDQMSNETSAPQQQA